MHPTESVIMISKIRWSWITLVALSLSSSGCLKSFIPQHLSGRGKTEASTTNSTSSSKITKDLADDEAAEVWVALGKQLEAKGHHANAIAAFEKAKQMDNQYVEPLAHRLGVLYDMIDEPSKAQIEFQRALKQNPKNADLLNDIGYSYYNRGNWVEAESYFRKALDHDSKHAKAKMNLGMTLAQNDKYEEAVRVFQEVVPEAEARANVAFLMLAQGKKEAAKEQYLLARSLDPTLKTVQIALEKLEKGESAITPAAATVEETRSKSD
jgi:tetratricopeptide (TPR) repeat protein